MEREFKSPGDHHANWSHIPLLFFKCFLLKYFYVSSGNMNVLEHSIKSLYKHSSWWWIGLPKVFVRICFINFTLLLLSSVLSYFEWTRLLDLPLVGAVSWTLLRTQIWFGGTIPVIVDGQVWIDHWSFTMILAIIVVNLVAVWQIEHKKT